MSGLKPYEIFQQLRCHETKNSQYETHISHMLLSYINESYSLPKSCTSAWRNFTFCSPRVFCDRSHDAISSLLVQNRSSTETLRVTLEIAGSEVKHYEVKVNTTRPIELALNSIPVLALCYQNICLLFSHCKYNAKLRYEKMSMPQYHFVINPFVMYFNAQELCFIHSGMYRQGRLRPNFLLPEDQPGFLLKHCEGAVHTWKLRHYEWIQAPEVTPGKYMLPVQDYQIISSIYVHVVSTQQLHLRPIFRHSYLLQPGHNSFELFFAEFWIPEKQSFYLEGLPGLTIWIRAGNQLEPKLYPERVVDKEMPPALLLTQDGWLYRRHATHVEWLDQLSEAAQCCKTLLLAFEQRVGAGSSLQRYLLQEKLSEKMLLRQIVDFL